MKTLPMRVNKLRVVQMWLYKHLLKKYLQRNAAIALGNSGDRTHVPYLVEALRDPEPLVRGYAAWAMGRLGGAEARSSIERAFSQEADESARREMESALAC